MLSSLEIGLGNTWPLMLSSADPLRVLQETRKKQNEELILLTLAVPQTEGVEKRIQLLLQQRKQLDVSSRIIM